MQKFWIFDKKIVADFFPYVFHVFFFAFSSIFIEKVNKHRQDNQYHSTTLYLCTDSINTSIFTLKTNIPEIVKPESGQLNSLIWWKNWVSICLHTCVATCRDTKYRKWTKLLCIIMIRLFSLSNWQTDRQSD